jgi:hypothetical protein
MESVYQRFSSPAALYTHTQLLVTTTSSDGTPRQQHECSTRYYTARSMQHAARSNQHPYTTYTPVVQPALRHTRGGCRGASLHLGPVDHQGGGGCSVPAAPRRWSEDRHPWPVGPGTRCSLDHPSYDGVGLRVPGAGMALQGKSRDLPDLGKVLITRKGFLALSRCTFNPRTHVNR